MTADAPLGALVAILEQLRQLFPKDFPKDKATWDSRPVVRLAVERLWIMAGNLAETYRIEQGIASGIEPWSELVGYRHLLAHALPGDISADRVYPDTTGDLDRILEAVRGQHP